MKDPSKQNKEFAIPVLITNVNEMELCHEIRYLGLGGGFPTSTASLNLKSGFLMGAGAMQKIYTLSS